MELRRYLEERISEVSGLRMQYSFEEENQSQIVRLLFEEGEEDFARWLASQGVQLNADMTQEGWSLRIGFHYYNNRADIERLVDVIKKYERRK